jgi:hypothetical protein
MSQKSVQIVRAVSDAQENVQESSVEPVTKETVEEFVKNGRTNGEDKTAGRHPLEIYRQTSGLPKKSSHSKAQKSPKPAKSHMRVCQDVVFEAFGKEEKMELGELVKACRKIAPQLEPDKSGGYEALIRREFEIKKNGHEIVYPRLSEKGAELVARIRSRFWIERAPTTLLAAAKRIEMDPDQIKKLEKAIQQAKVRK